MRKLSTTTSLITIVLILIITVLALSTATFAWFSANNLVNISNISFIAEHNTDGDGDLRIVWGESSAPVKIEDIQKSKDLSEFTDGVSPLKGMTSLDACAKSIKFNYESSSLPYTILQPEFNNAAISLSPAMPKIAPYKNMPQLDFIKSIYASNTSYRIENGELVEYYYSEPNQNNVIAICSRGNIDWAHRDTFYVYNVNEAYAQRVSINYSIDSSRDDLIKALRCAVFIDGGLAGILGYADKIYYGEIVKDANIKDNLNYVNRALTYDSAHPEINADNEPSDKIASLIGTQTSVFTFDVEYYATIRMLFYVDGHYVSNQTARNAFSLSMSLTGEFIER